METMPNKRKTDWNLLKLAVLKESSRAATVVSSLTTMGYTLKLANDMVNTIMAPVDGIPSGELRQDIGLFITSLIVSAGARMELESATNKYEALKNSRRN